MSSQNSRYVFTDYKNIRTIKFKKLEHICSKLFILIDASEEYIPLSLVRDIQKLGKAAKWITIHDSDHTLDYHIIYLMGKLHHKINKDVEFAVLSENEELSSVIRHINSDKRRCIRIRIKSETVAAFNSTPPKRKETKEETETFEKENNTNKAPADRPQRTYITSPNLNLIPTEKEMLIKAAHATIERLQLKGKDARPYNRSTLLKYIEFNNEQWTEREGRSLTMLDYLISHGYVKFEGDIVKYSLPRLDASTV